jgi:hypothetical protein
MKLGAHIDHTHSISIDRLGEKYYLMIVIDGIDFVWPQTCQVRTNPKDLLHEFLTMSRLKISTIRFDVASEFGKSSSFIAYYTHHDIFREPLASYTHIQNARAEGAIIICKEHVWCLLRSDNMPREHPHVANTTHDDRAEEGVFLGNDLTTPNFWMYSFRAKKVMMLSDPKHWVHILPFMQLGDVPHRISLTDADIRMLLMATKTVMYL